MRQPISPAENTVSMIDYDFNCRYNPTRWELLHFAGFAALLSVISLLKS